MVIQVYVKEHLLPDIDIEFEFDEDGAMIGKIWCLGKDCTNWFYEHQEFIDAVENHLLKKDLYSKAVEEAREEYLIARFESLQD